MLDLEFAIAHHLLVFAICGILAAEVIAVQPDMERQAIVRIATVDLFYGALAGLILIVGFSRAYFAAKGWAYYSHNLFFWAKVADFAVIGLLSVPPTLTYLRWKRQGAAPAAEVSRVRRYLLAEVALFALLPVFAAAMARGYGLLT
jgi:putative membrane protein